MENNDKTSPGGDLKNESPFVTMLTEVFYSNSLPKGPYQLRSRSWSEDEDDGRKKRWGAKSWGMSEEIADSTFLNR